MVRGVIEVRYNNALCVATESTKELFTLPGIYAALSSIILAILLPIIWMESWKIGYKVVSYLEVTAFLTVTNFLLLWRSAPYLTIRRTLWACFFILLPLALGSFLEPLEVPYISFSYTSVLLNSLISWSLGDDLRSEINPLVTASLIVLFSGRFMMFSIVSSLTGIISAYLVSKVIEKLSYPITGLKGFDSVKALAELALESKESRLEESMEERGIEGVISYDILQLGKYILITADLHPGPFKIGSFNAPAEILHNLESMGLYPLFLRRGCSHERNLASRRYLREFIDHISREITRTKPCCIGEPIHRSTGSFEITAQRIGETILFTVSGRPLGSFEDIPHKIEELVEDKLGSPVSVIDRHDSIERDHYQIALPSTEIGKELVNSLVELGKEALARKCQNLVRVGYSYGHTDWPSLGAGGIRVLSISTDNWSISYVSIDGNNMLPSLRDEIVRQAPKETTVVIATTDTHEVLSTKITFNPVGVECGDDEECIRQYASYISELIRNSLENQVDVKEPKYLRGRKEVKFMGEELMMGLTLLMKFGAMYRYLLSLALLPQVVFLLLSI